MSTKEQNRNSQENCWNCWQSNNNSCPNGNCGEWSSSTGTEPDFEGWKMEDEEA